jgi:hypothetical protein
LTGFDCLLDALYLDQRPPGAGHTLQGRPDSVTAPAAGAVSRQFWKVDRLAMLLGPGINGLPRSRRATAAPIAPCAITATGQNRTDRANAPSWCSPFFWCLNSEVWKICV